MIRKLMESDMEGVLSIWLEASIQAHDFVEAAFWESQLENMRNIYIPASEAYVYEMNNEVAGFYALHEDSLAAIFVAPKHQRQGIGKLLLADAKTKRSRLTLSVYKENKPSIQFYLSQGLAVISEQTDEHTGHLEYTMSSAAPPNP